jgi:hypothetical protein
MITGEMLIYPQEVLHDRNGIIFKVADKSPNRDLVYDPEQGLTFWLIVDKYTHVNIEVDDGEKIHIFNQILLGVQTKGDAFLLQLPVPGATSVESVQESFNFTSTEDVKIKAKFYNEKDYCKRNFRSSYSYEVEFSFKFLSKSSSGFKSDSFITRLNSWISFFSSSNEIDQTEDSSNGLEILSNLCTFSAALEGKPQSDIERPVQSHAYTITNLVPAPQSDEVGSDESSSEPPPPLQRIAHVASDQEEYLSVPHAVSPDQEEYLSVPHAASPDQGDDGDEVEILSAPHAVSPDQGEYLSVPRTVSPDQEEYLSVPHVVPDQPDQGEYLSVPHAVPDQPDQGEYLSVPHAVPDQPDQGEYLSVPYVVPDEPDCSPSPIWISGHWSPADDNDLVQPNKRAKRRAIDELDDMWQQIERSVRDRLKK